MRLQRKVPTYWNVKAQHDKTSKVERGSAGTAGPRRGHAEVGSGCEAVWEEAAQAWPRPRGSGTDIRWAVWGSQRLPWPSAQPKASSEAEPWAVKSASVNSGSNSNSRALSASAQGRGHGIPWVGFRGAFFLYSTSLHLGPRSHPSSQSEPTTRSPKPWKHMVTGPCFRSWLCQGWALYQ